MMKDPLIILGSQSLNRSAAQELPATEGQLDITPELEHSAHSPCNASDD